MTSLRGKITTSYGLSKIALLIFVAIVIADLYYLQTQIAEGEAVNEFFTATQEIRFGEKNLFLYHDQNDLEKLNQQLDIAQTILYESKRVFSEIASPEELKQVGSLLNKYRAQLQEYAGLSGQARQAGEAAIRISGHAISELIRDFNQRERAVLTNTTQVAARTLMAASLTVILIGIASATFMVRRVVRPLRELENQLDQLAEGNEQSLSLSYPDKEIQSFVHHFNSMLDQLRTQQTQTRQHEKAAALGVLVSGVAHELNNPLSNISTSVQLLLEDDGSTREDLRRQWLAHVDGECERARRIVRRLLDTVRHPDLHMQSYGADAVVQSAVMLIHRQLDPEIYLHIEDVPDTPLLLDRERMQQVFINLIHNAVDAGAKNIWVIGRETNWEESMPANTDYLVGEIDQIRHTEKVLQFYIDDDGPGISNEHLTQIFNPFFTTKSSGEGTGLGLYLVEEIISEHNGCMSVENREAGGTRFMIWLPVSLQAQEQL